jgi:hypothetical protein
VRQQVGAALSHQRPGLDQRSHALFEEEGVPARARDQVLSERGQARVAAEKGVEGLDLALAQQQPLDRIERALASLRGVEGLPFGGVDGDVEEPRTSPATLTSYASTGPLSPLMFTGPSGLTWT